MKPDKLYLKLLAENVARNDDEKSFEKLFKIFYDRLVAFSNYFVHSHEIAEEVVSEVFVKVWNNRRQLGNVQNVEAYLFAATRNQSLNNLNKEPFSSIHVSEQAQPDLRDLLIDIFDPERELEIQELRFNIDLTIESLPAQCKAVFKMIREEGLRYKEVADILNISPRTVETQLVRALRKLDAALSPYIEKRLKREPSRPGQVTQLKNLLLSFLF